MSHHTLIESKQRASLRVSVVIPAKNEEDTIAPIVNAIRRDLMNAEFALVDELIVIDSNSTDRTAAIARASGAVVYSAREIHPELGNSAGKGEALWKAQFVVTGDVLVFIDADLTSFTSEYIVRLLAPLLTDQRIALVKSYYDRDLVTDDGSKAAQGGRVTELTARPILTLWWPELANIAQPLGGEWAIRRDVFEQLSIPRGYGIELAVLIDVCESLGIDAIAQVDLGVRAHRHQDLQALSAMAAEVLAAAERRRTGRVHDPDLSIAHASRVRRDVELTWTRRAVNVSERPPFREYRSALNEAPAPRTQH